MKKKTALEEALAKAKTSGAYMVSVWYRDNAELKQFRVTEGFPVKDVPLALDMLKKDLDTLTTPTPRPGRTIQPPRQPVAKK